MALWMKELDGVSIPNIPQTDGTCAGSPDNFAKAADYGWWSCGGHTRVTDVTACPTKDTWGVSFDDGPGAYTGCVPYDLKTKFQSSDLAHFAENCSNTSAVKISSLPSSLSALVSLRGQPS